MPGFTPHHGEGAVSTGLMVPVHDAKSVVEARTISDLLEKHQIPALVNLEVEGILFPWKDPPKNAAARVLVPSQMLPMARDILKRAGREGQKQQASFGMGIGARDTSYSPPKSTFEARAPHVVPVPTNLEPESEEDDTGPIDLVLPEPSPLNQRVLVALLAIALGTAFQRVLEMALGASGTMEFFAARSPLTQEVWRLVTAGFLHGGPEHFLSNAVFGLVIGVVLFGTHRVGAVAFVWMISSMIGMAAEVSLTTQLVLVAGASAGNYGLLGLWSNGQWDRARRSLLPTREKMRTIGILLLLAPGALTPISSTKTKIAVLAHIGGYLAGFLLGFIFRRRLISAELPEIARRSKWAFIAAAGIAVTGLSVALFRTFS